MSEKTFTIVNGAAGGGRCRARADRVLARLERAGLSLDVHLTEGPEHASELAEEAYENGSRRFISVGGDGTSYEVVNGLFPRAHEDGEEVTLGMLPLGTGNSFLRDFGITNEDAAFDAIVRGKSRPVDVLRFEHEDGVLYYINTVGIGFVPRVGALTNERFKTLGTAGYIAAVVACTVNLEYLRAPYRIAESEDAIEGAIFDQRENTFVSFSNSRFTGGAMMMAPVAEVADGLLDVVRVNRLSRADLITTFPRIFTGTFIDHPAVEQKRAAVVEFEPGPTLDVLVDGEQKRLAPRRITVLPSALQVLA